MFEIQDNLGTMSGSIIAGLFILGMLLSKFRVLWTKDSAETAISAAQTSIVEMLRAENTRLHEQVMSLQQEVAKLQMLVAELTNKITHYEIKTEQQRYVDELAKAGKFERRGRRNSDEDYHQEIANISVVLNQTKEDTQ